jgi:beta-alanine--pyruvate transaminase
MGAVFVREGIYNAFMHGSEYAIELPHGYTYSGHPLACAAGLATLELYEEEGIFERANSLAQYWEDAVHSLKGLPHVIDLRNLGIIAGIELESIPGKPGVRAYECLVRCFEQGLLIRTTGDIIALSPPLILEKHHIDQMMEMLAKVLKEVD